MPEAPLDLDKNRLMRVIDGAQTSGQKLMAIAIGHLLIGDINGLKLLRTALRTEATLISTRWLVAENQPPASHQEVVMEIDAMLEQTGELFMGEPDGE